MIDWPATKILSNTDEISVISTSKIVAVCLLCSKQFAIRYNSYKCNINRNNSSYKCHKCHNKENVSSTAKKLSNKYSITGNDYLDIKCHKCNNSFNIKIRNIKANKRRNNGDYTCASCAHIGLEHSNDTKELLSLKSKQLHSNGIFRTKWSDGNSQWYDSVVIGSDEYCGLMSKCGKKAWSDEFRTRFLKFNNDPEQLKIKSDYSKQLWQSEEYKKKISETKSTNEYKAKIELLNKDPNHIKKLSEASIKKWACPDYRAKINKTHATEEYKEKMAKAAANRPLVSRLATTFYSILDDLNVKYYREYNDKPHDEETKIGHYRFDCVIPRNDQRTLLVEIQGEVHDIFENSKRNDKAKATYINEYFPSVYELKYVWHQEFGFKDKIRDKVKYWLGITNNELIDFDFNDVIIKEIDHKDCYLLLSKYHYLSNAVRFGIYYGAFLGDKLIAACVFSPMVRNNILSKFDVLNKDAKELSRFCIDPSYQKMNFGSWIISKCLKLLKKKSDNVKLVISYSDTTYNNHGALYKASNFIEDGLVDSDYWYVDNDGYVMGKQKLYSKAVAFRMTESKYADANNYHKVFGFEKKRFIYWL